MAENHYSSQFFLPPPPPVPPFLNQTFVTYIHSNYLDTLGPLLVCFRILLLTQSFTCTWVKKNTLWKDALLSSIKFNKYRLCACCILGIVISTRDALEIKINTIPSFMKLVVQSTRQHLTCNIQRFMLASRKSNSSEMNCKIKMALGFIKLITIT